MHANRGRHARKAVAVYYHRVGAGNAVRILFVRHVSGDLALPGGSLKGRDFQGAGTDEYARTAEREALEEVAAMPDHASEWVDACGHHSSESWHCQQMRRQFRELLRVSGPHPDPHVHKERMEFVTADSLHTTHHVYLVDITRRMQVLYGCESALQRACDQVHAFARAHPRTGGVARETVGVRFMDLQDALGFCKSGRPVVGDILYHVTAQVLRRIPLYVWCTIAVPHQQTNRCPRGSVSKARMAWGSSGAPDMCDTSDPSDASELSDDYGSARGTSASSCTGSSTGSGDDVDDDGWKVVGCPRQSKRRAR